MKTIAICFVCLGNICRSPTAEGVMRHQLIEAKLGERIHVDSAGTGDWHVDEAPDERAQRAASQRGYDLSVLRGRQIDVADFERFDLLIAMDDANVSALRKLCPPAQRDKIRLLMEFVPETDRRWAGAREVTDPYFGGAAGFEQVLDQCEAACRGLVAALRPQLLQT
ncbi:MULTISPECIES: low molecular weight protein-tyrosine-phosphatase [Paraburkholderia]|uniref:low molecular weight protein-tyrosine-phosphatase n=1 Tax=Paraburkholderia TaxID=1822464 RepID=UPI00224FF798|nr:MULTISPECIES: low molecular weight protein-tyrosine-phosphatase [Paraburkholderia]MCX4162210.1 low molecular weight phosphotyrosine protein phosphatase [Paraburkholderia megapolitana]MDN7157705.1 low molecular weight phosphotyrosine protein phosphatase [Paraburkholderia sp. CHISQ3]MDQ6494752.1 low molecular weight phosphotyrosine protein phosphatase [Paraburkholderia megapolitana]